jgi:hypothetical protein
MQADAPVVDVYMTDGRSHDRYPGKNARVAGEAKCVANAPQRISSATVGNGWKPI